MSWGKKKRGGNDGKYLRLTGLWQSKNKENLYTGKLRAEDVEKLAAKIEEADGSDIGFFLWVNEQESRKDPQFTLQCAVSESDGGFSSKKRNRRDEEEEEDQEEQKDDEEEEDEDDQPKKSGGKAKASGKASTTSGKSKGKKNEDW